MTKMVDTVVAAAPSFGVEAKGAAVRDTEEIERSIEAFAQKPNGALIVPSNSPINQNLELVHSLAARHRLPTIGVYRFFSASGGLMSWGIDDVD
jgi:putative ABC transport system substrate-binding protein